MPTVTASPRRAAWLAGWLAAMLVMAGAGRLVYAERIDIVTVVGAGLILGADLLNLRRTPAAAKGSRMATST